MKPDCQLEEFFVTRLHIDHRQQKSGENQGAHQLGYGFDYFVGVHKEDKFRYRMAFRFTGEEISESEQPVGLKIDAEIMGFFSINPELDAKNREMLVRLNGSSILYGILRGILATATGLFPDRKLTLPTILPKEIVQIVENKKITTTALEKSAKKEPRKVRIRGESKSKP